MKHRITQEALADLLKVLQLHCPSPNNIPSTVYHFKSSLKIFSTQSITTIFAASIWQRYQLNLKFAIIPIAKVL